MIRRARSAGAAGSRTELQVAVELGILLNWSSGWAPSRDSRRRRSTASSSSVERRPTAAGRSGTAGPSGAQADAFASRSGPTRLSGTVTESSVRRSAVRVDHF